MKREEEDRKEEVRLQITNLEETPEVEDIQAEGVEGETAEVVADDVPLAITDEAANESAEDGEFKRSGWRLFFSEDLPQLTLREILGGDYLLGSLLRRNIWFILLLVLLGVLYISNRYAAQQDIIEEENLRKELVEKKNYALTQYAELTMKSRQSYIEKKLREFGDETLSSPQEPPFIIRVKEKE